jgi:hypothetical protein
VSDTKKASSTEENRKAGEPVNDLLPFLEFVESSPVGARVAGAVDRYSSHGAYVSVGDVSVYVPLRSMADPPPKSARAHVKIGEHVDVTIVGFVAERRSIDGAFDGGIKKESTTAEPSEQSVPARSKRSTSKAPTTGTSKTAVKKPAKKAAAKKTPAKKAAAKKVVAKTPAKKAAAKKSAAVAKKAAAKSAAPKKAATKRTAVKKTAATKVVTLSRSRKADEA